LHLLGTSLKVSSFVGAIMTTDTVSENAYFLVALEPPPLARSSAGSE